MASADARVQWAISQIEGWLEANPDADTENVRRGLAVWEEREITLSNQLGESGRWKTAYEDERRAHVRTKDRFIDYVTRQSDYDEDYR